MYHYKLVSTALSSHDLGPCDVCGKHASEVFQQTEERDYTIVSGLNHLRVAHGRTYEGCANLFGHKNCLESKQRN